jgi:WD40 repeat protein
MAEALRITAKKEGSDEPEDLVFLCHNSLDKPFIERIADALELEFGTTFFLDVFAIPTGEEFIPWIEKALAECAACAIFLGANGWGPTHLWEAELALARYRRDPTLRIIPVALPGLDREEAAKLGSGKLFQDVNWADFTKGAEDRDSLEKLEAALTGRRVLGYRGPARLTPYQMRRDAERWEKSGRKDASILYGGGQLVEAERMARDNPDAVVLTDVAAFLTASRERQSRFWRRTAILSGAAGLLLATASIVAATNYLLAEQRRLGSVSRQLAMAARDAAGPDRAMLIAARAVLIDETAEATAALLEQLQDFRFLRRVVDAGSYVEAAALGADGHFLLGTDSGVAKLAIDDISPRAEGSMQSGAVTAILEGDGAIWLGRGDGRVDVSARGESRTLVSASLDMPAGRDRRVRSLAYEPSKRLLALGTGSGRIAVVRLTDGAVVYDGNEGAGTRINSLSFDPTRARLAAGTSDGIVLLDTKTMRSDLRYPRVDGGVLALAYTQDGSLAAIGGEGRLYFFDRRNPELERPTTGDVVPLATAAAIDGATSRVAVGDASGVVRLYDAASGQGTGAEPLHGHSDPVTAIVFGKGKDDLMSASSNGTVAVWDLAGGQGPGEELPQFNPSPTVIRAEADGSLLGATSDGNHAEVRRLVGQDWKPLIDLIAKTHEAGDQKAFFVEPKPDAEGFVDIAAPVPAVALSDDGGRLAWSTSGGAVLAMSMTQPGAKPTIVVGPGGAPPQDLAISGDGRTLALLYDEGTRISVHDIGDLSNAVSVIPPSATRSIALSHGGALLAVGMKDGRLAQYSRASGWTRLDEPWPVHLSEVAGVSYSADDRLIVSFGSGGGGTDRSVAFSNASGKPDPRRLQSRQVAGTVSAMSVGAKGGAAVGDRDGQVLLWSAPNARYSGRLTAGMSYTAALLVDDERRRILTANGDGSFRSWTLDSARWVSLACAKANRGWRPEEWHELLPDDRYVKSCSARHAPAESGARK